MFFRQVDQNITLGLSIPYYAEELFALTHRNRAFLARWLPWLDNVTSAADTRVFIEDQLARFQRGEALHVTIFHQENIAGVLGYNQIDQANGTGLIGYWLGEEFNGKGIMTASVRDLIAVGFKYFSLQRLEIRCAVGNVKSRAVAERLGFTQEGFIRHGEKVGGHHLDMAVYGLLREERKR